MSSLELATRQQYDNFAHMYDQRWDWYITKTWEFFRTWLEVFPLGRL
jgi:hypothetical protein